MTDSYLPAILQYMICLNCNHSSGNHNVPWPYEQSGSGNCSYRTDYYEWCLCTFLRLKNKKDYIFTFPSQAFYMMIAVGILWGWRVAILSYLALGIIYTVGGEII